jgi:hypothetical protein
VTVPPVDDKTFGPADIEPIKTGRDEDEKAVLASEMAGAASAEATTRPSVANAA